MPLNSVNTNIGATIALQSLNMTNTALQATQKRISTGFRVADANDDGAAYAVAQRVRSDVAALTSANEQLGKVQGLLSTTSSALNKISTLMSDARAVLVKLGDDSTTGSERAQYIQQYQSTLQNIKSDFKDSTYSGKTLIGNINGAGGYGNVAIMRNELGATYGIASFSASAFMASITFNTTQLNSATSVAKLTGTAATATFINRITALGTAMNTYGAAAKYVTNQVSYNSDKIDAMNNGLGALIDADLAKEFAKLQSLQIRQQLGTQSLSIANQAPQSLLSLFK